MRVTGDQVKNFVAAKVDEYKLTKKSIFNNPVNSREYACIQPDCDRKAYAKGLCNAHYLRSVKGLDMSQPIRIRKRDGSCSECGEQVGNKGGWGMCPSHYKKARYAIIKDSCIELLGGCCQSCGGVFPRSVYDFHHIEGKDDSPSTIIGNGSFSKIAEEISKCVLLCANCHRIEHHHETHT
jgi:hypothetical protein